MKVNRLLLKQNEKEVVEEDIDFSKDFFDANHVRRIPSCHVKLTLTDFGDVLECLMEIKADVIASCSYTLEDLPLKVNVKEKLYFTSNEEDKDSDEMIYEPGNEIDMDNYVLGYVIASVPHNAHKKGAKLPSEGKGYRVLTEDELLKERSSTKKSSPFDCLDDIDL